MKYVGVSLHSYVQYIFSYSLLSWPCRHISVVVDRRLILSSLVVFFPTGTKSHSCFGSSFQCSSLTLTLELSSVCNTKPRRIQKEIYGVDDYSKYKWHENYVISVWMRPISTQENFPLIENFPKISLFN